MSNQRNNHHDYDLTNMNAVLADVRAEQRNIDNAGTRYVSAEGLALLAEEGVYAFQEATGHYLPHNIVRSQMSGSVGTVGAYGRRLPLEEADKEIESHARFGGWLKAATTLPAVRKMIERTQSSRGINSDYTYCDLWEVVSRFPSPGNLERLLWKVRRRSEAILAAYEGDFAPAWRDVINALLRTRSVGKTAVITSAATLGMEIRGEWDYDKNKLVRPSYQQARDWLAERRIALFPNEASDSIHHAGESELAENGIKVFAGLAIGRFGSRSLVWVARKGDKMFVAEKWQKVQDVLKAAIDEWGTRKESEEVVVTSIRLADNHPYDGQYYHYRYEVRLELGGRSGRFSVSEHYAHNRESHNVTTADGDGIYDADARELFKLIEKSAGDGASLPSGSEVIELLGPTEQTMEALGFRKESNDEPEVEITSKAFGAGIIDYWYRGPGGELFFRDRGRTGNGATNSSWYSYNGGGQVCKHLSEAERVAMVS